LVRYFSMRITSTPTWLPEMGTWRVRAPSTGGLFGLPFPIDDQQIASVGEARKSERDRVGKGCMVFKGQAHMRQAFVERDRLSFSKRVAIENQMQAMTPSENVKALA
jgi:hypothetical protein